MIENYGVFNNHEINNELLLLFSDEQISKKIIKGNISVLFHEDKIIGYAIKDFLRYAKIKYSGIIFLPHHHLIDVINSILINSSLEPLAYKNSSGYIVKKVNDKKIVYAIPGVFLRDKSISKGHICSYYDLCIDHEHKDDILELDNDVILNIDFFKMEVK